MNNNSIEKVEGKIQGTNNADDLNFKNVQSMTGTGELNLHKGDDVARGHEVADNIDGGAGNGKLYGEWEWRCRRRQRRRPYQRAKEQDVLVAAQAST